MADKSVEEGKMIAGLMYLVSILGIIGWAIAVILFVLKKDNEYVKYHFQQWLVLIIAGVIVGAVGAITSVILIGFVILLVGGIILLVFWIIGMINAFTGKKKPLPWIGQYGEKLNL
ncbi:MAG: DUF4870 domain-containing protein [Candidatus Woesearchaeota archaeon]